MASKAHRTGNGSGVIENQRMKLWRIAWQ
jgi:hypothetical protein